MLSLNSWLYLRMKCASSLLVNKILNVTDEEHKKIKISGGLQETVQNGGEFHCRIIYIYFLSFIFTVIGGGINKKKKQDSDSGENWIGLFRVSFICS